MSGNRSRILSLQGGINFRDLGGYRTSDGRELIWGKVFRTGVLSYFVESDHGCLKDLGVRTICDLRRKDEREREPTCWPGATPLSLEFDDGETPPTIRTIATRYPDTAAGMHAAMIDLYRELPVWMAPRIRALFHHIAAGDTPIVVHCAAGKDRTGIAIALLLDVLGVRRETIFQDYLLTNEFNFESFILSRHAAQLGVAVTNHPLLTLKEDVRRVLFAAHTDYLQGTFLELDARFGGIERFLDECGVDNNLRAGVREQLLA